MQAHAAMLTRLEALRGDFSTIAVAEKLRLMHALATRPLARAALLRRWHALLAYARAFPDSAEVHALATRALGRFHNLVARLPRRERRRLLDSGIAGTTVCYRYSFDVASWLVEHYPDSVRIDWPALADDGPLDELLGMLVEPAEDTAYSEGGFTARSWFALARGKSAGTDFDWFVRELQRCRHDREGVSELFETADIPVGWRLGDCPWSISRNVLPIARPHFRTGFRKPPADAAAWIATPLDGIRRLSSRDGRRVIDVAIAALAVRQREVYSMNRANPAEVWHAPLGEGCDLAVFGVTPDARPVLEGNYGYMIFANGAPVGYGGVSPLFAQGNTGINIFPEYRKSEAPFLFVQTLRSFATLFACRHFIANPYQFGRDNPEAIASGAFWFYYRLGFRSTDAAARGIAEREAALLARVRQHRTSKRTLRELAKSDLVLSLSGADPAEIFEERWLLTLARGAAVQLAKVGALGPGWTRREIVARSARTVAQMLETREPSRGQKSGDGPFAQLALYASLIPDLSSWRCEDRRALGALFAAKSQANERTYCRLLLEHAAFRAALAAWCRDEEARTTA